MCNIIHLKPDFMPKKDEFWNMCYNNWHSFGLVTRVDGRLDIIKECPDSGEIDPQKIWDLLDNDLEYERILHVRHMTAGSNTIDNAHPFDVYFDPATGKQIVFMHNGTLYQYKSKKEVPTTTGFTVEDDDSGPSDSKNFVDKLLVPLISGSNFGTGKGDIQHPFFQKLIRDLWVGNNRGVLIANDQAPFFFGDWKIHEGMNNVKFRSANTEYFDRVQRGPEFSRREAAKRAAEEAARKKEGLQSGTSLNNVVPLSMFQFGAKHGFFQLKDSPTKILSDWNVYDRPGAVQVGMFTKDELEEIYTNKRDCISLMEWIFADYNTLYYENEQEIEKHERASKKIAELQNRINELENALAVLEPQKDAA